jgi:hypothetical protein
MSTTPTFKEVTLKHHSDSAHGWLEVSKSMARLHLREKYLQISCFSFMRGKTLYLEEDSDAPLLIEAMREAGINIKFEELDTEDSPIRQYDGFMA